MDFPEWQRVLDTNLTAVYRVTQAMLESIPENGSIINITSAVALRGFPGLTHYTASKAGIIGFTRALCKELGPRRIRVNAVAPGLIETDQARGLTAESRARHEGMIAFGRLGKADEVAGPVLFLASDLSRYVTGQTLIVDGGI
jgi:3-oxoacyl-[acyl-carrier protein] reductase